MNKGKNNRGAPSGNKNAMKFGFYNSAFTKKELGDLKQFESVDLRNEIDVLRVMIRRTMNLAGGVESLDQAISLLGALGIASSRLATLLRVQNSLGSANPEVGLTLSQAMAEVVKELGLDHDSG